MRFRVLFLLFPNLFLFFNPLDAAANRVQRGHHLATETIAIDLDTASKFNFLIAIEQRDFAHLRQIHANRIVDLLADLGFGLFRCGITFEGGTSGVFFATLFANASITDLWGSVLMCTMFGAIISVVCSFKGMTASGGAEGVGRAVNQAVVIAMVAVFFFDFVFTAVLLATNPELQTIR